MQIQVTGRHLEVPDEVREYIHTKANKLHRFYDRIHEIEVIIDHESDLLTAEMIVRTDRKHTFVASDTGPEPMGLIDVVVDKIERQLRRHKEKNRNHKHEGKPELPGESP